MQEIIDIVGVSFFVALLTGMSMGWYLAALNRYVPVLSIRRSLITNFVGGVSFILPIAMQRTVTTDPNLEPTAWFAMWFLLIVFMTSADITNYVICMAKRK